MRNRAQEAACCRARGGIGRDNACTGDGGGDGPAPTPAGPGQSGPGQPSLVQDLADCRLLANKSEITGHFS